MLAVNLCEQVDIYGYTFSGAYYYNKVHNGNFSKKRPSRRPRSRRPGNGAAADPAAGEDGEGGEGEEAEDGEQVLEEGLDPEEMLEEGNAAFDLGQQSEGPGDDQGERRRRRLQVRKPFIYHLAPWCMYGTNAVKALPRVCFNLAQPTQRTVLLGMRYDEGMRHC